MAEKILMIALSPTMEEGKIQSWLKKEGDKIVSGDILCEVETDKASMDYESTQEGTLLKIVKNDGESALVGDIIAVLGAEGEDYSQLLAEESPAEVSDNPPAPVPETVSPDTIVENPGAQKENLRIKASPLARKLAKLKGVDLNLIKGSGPQGRIVKADIEQSSSAVSPSGAMPLEADQLIPLNTIQQISAKRLSESKFSAPHYYLKTTVSMDRLLGDRKLINESREDKISLNAVFIKMSAMALKKHRNINAGFEDNQIRQFSSVHIALAVALEKGLTTPVVKNCHMKSLEEIDSELKDLIARARAGRLKADELGPATFTISNLGQYEIDEFTAIINPPASAILAVPRARKVPVVRNNEIVTETELKLTLSCDHRVIDGAAGAAFLSDLKRMMEMPLYAL